MQVSTAAPKKKLKAELKAAKKVRNEKIGTWSAKLARQPVARNVTFSMTVNPDGSDNDGPLLSAQFGTLEGEADGVGSSDGSQRSEEEGDDMEGEDTGEGEDEDAGLSGGDRSSGQTNNDGSASCTSDGSANRASQGDGDDDRSDE